VVSDTHPEVEALLLEGYRRMSPNEKLRRVQELNEAVLQLAAARIQRQYGPLTERELRLRVASLWLARGTMINAFGWDPEERGR
jgi:hypothetical protein